MTAVWARTDLGQSETLVLLALADHADDYGHCWPSIDRIAEKARLKRRATQALIKRLETAGLITVHRGSGKGHTSRYTLTLNGAVDARIEQQNDAQNAPNENANSASDTPLNGAEDAPNGEQRVHLTTSKGAVAAAPESSRTTRRSRAHKNRSHFCPPDFEPNDALLEWAAEEFPKVDVKAETAKFRDFEFERAYSDWNKAWRNWIRNSVKFGGRKVKSAERGFVC